VATGPINGRGRRVDLGGVDAATAERLLRRYGGVVRGCVRDRAGAGSDREDLIAVGRLAVLEAYVTHRAERALEATWVRKIVRWRVTEESLEQASGREDLLGFVDSPAGDQYDPEAHHLRQLLREAVERGQLGIREQMVVDGRLRDETFVRIGQVLGISSTRAHQVYKVAVTKLRRWADFESKS